LLEGLSWTVVRDRGCGIQSGCLEGKATRETLLASTATAARHATTHTAKGTATAAALEVEAASTTTASSSHAATEHLHKDLGVDAAAHTTHAAHATAAAKHIRGINKISAGVVSLAFSIVC
jgi:hypothetical protein